MNDYLEEFAPSIKTMLDENPEMKETITHDDGNIYFLPVITDGNAAYDMFFITSTLKTLKMLLFYLIAMLNCFPGKETQWRRINKCGPLGMIFMI